MYGQSNSTAAIVMKPNLILNSKKFEIIDHIKKMLDELLGTLNANKEILTPPSPRKLINLAKIIFTG